MEKELDLNVIKKFSKNYNKKKVNKVIENAVKVNGVGPISYNPDYEKELSNQFSIEVKDIGTITNQKQSGRCWMFAGLNVLRRILIKNLKVSNIELSQSYLMFYDKLEKSNYELESVLDYIDEEDNSRILDTILTLGGQQDGGFWHFFVNLVKKYGVVPKPCMDETTSSSASMQMDTVLETLITKDVAILRNSYKEGKTIDELRAAKEEMLEEIYRVLAICLGEPISEFTFVYKPTDDTKKDDKKNDDKKEEKKDDDSPVVEYKTIKSTPIDFFNKYIAKDLDEYVSLVNWPIKGYPLYRSYSSKLTQNVYGAELGKSVNVPLDVMKKAAIESLKNNDLCWFACDVSSFSERKKGYLATELFQYDDVFNVKLNFDKGDRLMLRASSCNHAMMLSGVNLDKKNKPNKWKVTNSWGSTYGFEGTYVMSDHWFDEFVYEVVVNKKYLSEDVLKAYESEAILLEPWAPVNNF